MQMTKTNLLDKLQALLPFFFRLARKTDNDIGRNIEQRIDLP